jgi:hypothetical protein
LWSELPQAVTARAETSAQAATAACRGVLRIAGRLLLILDPGRAPPAWGDDVTRAEP